MGSVSVTNDVNGVYILYIRYRCCMCREVRESNRTEGPGVLNPCCDNHSYVSFSISGDRCSVLFSNLAFAKKKSFLSTSSKMCTRHWVSSYSTVSTHQWFHSTVLVKFFSTENLFSVSPLGVSCLGEEFKVTRHSTSKIFEKLHKYLCVLLKRSYLFKYSCWFQKCHIF